MSALPLDTVSVDPLPVDTIPVDSKVLELHGVKVGQTVSVWLDLALKNSAYPIVITGIVVGATTKALFLESQKEDTMYSVMWPHVLTIKS